MREKYIPFGGSPTTLDRLNANIDRSGGEDACWEWQAYRTKKGYGVIALNAKKRHTAHRVVLASVIGRDLEPHEFALHSCDNPPCCNPRHLSVGSNLENMRQASERGRFKNRPTPKGPGLKGIKHPLVKLTEEQVRSIRARYAAGGITQATLANEFMVDQTTISDIVGRRRWKHLD